ncbi:DJ-1/PfpI family protein [Litoreibacter roseus]|uniref:ThiJ/PfpI family protein n=1 Tax=Litoreibacter roseus TaxID=2601869 RepID=A0A6N6JDA1_9RHOB|nr:DJ-1/PfpI family protein [Litoreibacter roseus]GFE63172.1 ThiJ/PfpI family protein [Litoreibacter roseus]
MRTLAALVFPGFQTLDFFGPIEMLGDPAYEIDIITVAKAPGPVASRHGQQIIPDNLLSSQTSYDLLLIPGGDSALIEAKDETLLQWIRDVSDHAERVMAVCTGTILLGMTGLLDGRRATTNKLDFNETVHLAPGVDWVKQARWVQDGKFFTSSGVSAGIDMTLATLADLYKPEMAQETATGSEYCWNQDPTNDPFARSAGLI